MKLLLQGEDHNGAGQQSVEIKTDNALHGGTNIIPEAYSAAVPVEKIDTPLPGIQGEGGTSRSVNSIT